MPIYEYACNGCGRRFEHLVRSSETATCPECNGGDLRRLLSTFAVTAGDGGGRAPRAELPAGCGRCGDPRGPGACAMG
jgi:putative FmdB family regulatory protein